MKILVSNSGGVDSTTALSMAIDKVGAENVSTVSFYYGQTLQKELECSKAIAEHYGIKNYRLDLSDIFKYSNCPLIATSDVDIPEKSYSDQIEENGEGAVVTYVPFRNGLLISAAATLAQSIYPDEEVTIYLGATKNDSDGQAYMDCSLPFREAMNTAVQIGTYNKVHLEYPVAELTKEEIVKLGLELGTPYELTYSCYEGREKACGKCGSCQLRKEAFEHNGVEDPIEYED